MFTNRSLEFTLNRVLMKVFRTTSMDVNEECRYWFGLLKMETPIAKRKQKFMAKYVQSDSVLCQLFAHIESVSSGILGLLRSKSLLVQSNQ